MEKFPTGTVTFLFTDIEGSTKLARAHHDIWESACARHHAILREAIEANNGYVFQIIGDAFCAAFNNAEDAFNAAIQSQNGLQNEKWEGTPIKVRMGIHSGKAELLADGQYQGYLTMSLVQRIMSAGHGGQVLLSGAAENLLRGQLPEDVELHDLGRHNFKDVPQAVRVFQVNAPDLQSEFPPLRTFDILPNNLPTQLTSFVGREKELADVKRLLSDTHMLTLIGPGGTGKTRLSIQAANDVLSGYSEGVWLVDLAPILDPLLVSRTTAITIGLRNEPQRPVIDMLCDYLAKKKMLIILDNCEHLVEACAQMSDRILHAASEVQILASSREALGIAGEVTYRVPSLGLPDVDHLPSLDSLSQYEAVKLFIDRATAAMPNFKVTNDNAPALAQICHRLDGIPLAIELAAAKIRVLGVEQIAKRLDDRFKLLTGGSRTAMERHQTLRAAVDWSYNLLPPEEQTLFRRLAVFIGGWTLEASEAVCGDDSDNDVLEILEQLINKSLVITEDQQGTSRFRMLETIRQYANEKLVDSGESEFLREKHLGFFLTLAETAEPHLYRHEQLEWLTRLDTDYENLRAALELALDKESAELSLRLCAALGMYWHIRGYWIEGSKWLARAFEQSEDDTNQNEKAARIGALCADAQLAENTDDIGRIGESAKSALELAKRLGDKRYIAIAGFWLGHHLFRNREHADALELLKQINNDFQELGEPYWEAYSHLILVGNLESLGKIEYTTINTKKIVLARKAGERTLLVISLTSLAFELFSINKLDESMNNAREADVISKQVGISFNTHLRVLASHAWLEGDYLQAENLLLQMCDQLNLLGEINNRSAVLLDLGELSMEQGHLEKAKEYIDEGMNIWGENIPPGRYARGLLLSSRLYNLHGDEKKYKQLLKKSINLYKTTLNRSYYKSALLNTLDPFHTFEPEITAAILGTIYASEKDPFLYPADPLNKRPYERAETHLRETLGKEAFESEFARGQKLSLDEAFELVLSSLEETDE